MKSIFLEKAVARDNAALIDANTLVSISEVNPISLFELEQDEKVRIIFQYQYFIRSLGFPVQICLRFVNKESQKALHRKRMAVVEEAIKEGCKNKFKEVLAECDEFRNWLKHFLEMRVRPMLLCYLVVPVYSSTNLIESREAYVEALQLLNHRTAHCISRLSSIRFRKKIKLNEKGSEWEKEVSERIQEKKALIALGLFKSKSNYYSVDSFRIEQKARGKIDDYARNNFFEQIFDEKEESLAVKRLDDSQVADLLESYCKDFVVLNSHGSHKYLFMKELSNLWISKGG